MIRFWLASLLLLTSCSLFKQANLGPDPRTDALILEGKQNLRRGNVMEAWDSFEIAREREFNRSSTAATYLAGYAAFKLGYDEIAESRFQEIIRDFPKSRYTDDAEYHLALILLRKGGALAHEFEGLDRLVGLASNARDSRMKSMALAEWRSFLFEFADRDVLETYSRTSPDAYKHYVMEALAYKILQQDGPSVASMRLEAYYQEGGRSTEFLDSFMASAGLVDQPAPPNKNPRWADPNLLRIALVLPFQINQVGYPAYLSEIPQNQVRPLEYYEGFQMALREFQANSSKKVFVKVLDSERDTFRTKRILRELDSLGIQAVIGDIYNTQSRIISEWAEQRQVAQVVPLSPSSDLVNQKMHTFLANPTAFTHGQKMADYAFQQLGLRHTYIFTDGTTTTQELLRGYQQAFIGLGGTVDTLLFSRFYESIAVEQIPDLVDQIPEQDFQAGIYIPLMGNEEASSLILNLLLQQGKQLPLLGSPHFRNNYTSIPSSTKSSFELIFSTSYLVESTAPGVQTLYRRYLQEYGFPPSEHVIQGYDMGTYLLHQMNRYSPAMGMSFSDFLRLAPKVNTLHLPFQFAAEQSNQVVNLGQYTELGIIKIQ